jgi:hypothetical protein
VDAIPRGAKQLGLIVQTALGLPIDVGQGVVKLKGDALHSPDVLHRTPLGGERVRNEQNLHGWRDRNE